MKSSTPSDSNEQHRSSYPFQPSSLPPRHIHKTYLVVSYRISSPHTTTMTTMTSTMMTNPKPCWFFFFYRTPHSSSPSSSSPYI